MKQTIVFITPPSGFLLDERVFQSLGILRVAAVAEKLGYRVEHLDLNSVSNFEEAVRSHYQNTDASIFAITATTPQMVAATNITKALRDEAEGYGATVTIILGGPHPTLVHAAWKNGSHRADAAMRQLLEDYDVVVAGDGEEAIGLALQDDAPVLIDADDPKTALFLTSKRLGELPLPARHLIDMDSYHYEIDGVRTTPIIGQLGCPFGCNFCAGRDSAMLRRIRMRPTASIIAEMRHIYTTYGIHGFMFFDDELNVNTKITELLQAIVELQNELGVAFRCRGFIKSELFTEEQARLMYMAGFRRILCGFESGNDRVLKNINKRATKDDNTRTMEIGHKYGLGVKALMSLGHPGESPETIEDTRKWLLGVKPQDFDCTIITAYPGSPYYDKAIPYGKDWVFETNGDKLYMEDVDYTQTEDFYKGGMDGYRSYVYTDDLNQGDIVAYRDAVERDVRRKLNIPFNEARPALRFEASMGMLPGTVYRSNS